MDIVAIDKPGWKEILNIRLSLIQCGDDVCALRMHIEIYLKAAERAFNTVFALFGALCLTFVLFSGPHNGPIIQLQLKWLLL